MDRKIFIILKDKIALWSRDINISTKMYLYFFPPKFYFPVWVIRALSELIFFSLIGYAVGGKIGGFFSVIGNCTFLVTRSIYARGSGIFVREKWMGTLIYVVISPFKCLRYVIGRNALNFLEGFISSVIMFYALGWGFDLFTGNLGIYLWYIPLITIIAFSTLGLSIIIAGSTFYARSSVYLANSIRMGLMIFCGIIFPLSNLPEIMQNIAYWLPITNGLLAVRQLLNVGTLSGQFFQYLVREMGIAVLYLTIGITMIRWMIKIGLKRGTLESF